jgi:hypothetical protein
MVWSSFIQSIELRLPPAQFDCRKLGFGAFIDNIINLSAKRIEGSNGCPTGGRQNLKSGGQVRAALGNF